MRSATSRAQDFGAAERAGEAQRQQRPVALAGERVRAQPRICFSTSAVAGALPLPGAADVTPDATEDSRPDQQVSAATALGWRKPRDLDAFAANVLPFDVGCE